MPSLTSRMYIKVLNIEEPRIDYPCFTRLVNCSENELNLLINSKTITQCISYNTDQITSISDKIDNQNEKMETKNINNTSVSETKTDCKNKNVFNQHRNKKYMSKDEKEEIESKRPRIVKLTRVGGEVGLKICRNR